MTIPHRGGGAGGSTILLSEQFAPRKRAGLEFMGGSCECAADEGQVHRLKLLKRQMYGRAGFLLLRRRVLPFNLRAEASISRSP
jgi:hypothetical protein